VTGRLLAALLVLLATAACQLHSAVGTDREGGSPAPAMIDAGPPADADAPVLDLDGGDDGLDDGNGADAVRGDGELRPEPADAGNDGAGG
jgi:hypothetical protein